MCMVVNKNTACTTGTPTPPVVTWQTVRLFLILSILLGWRSWQFDFIMAYPQAPPEMPLFLRLPQGYKRKGMTRKSHVLQLKRNVYGQKQAGRGMELIHGSGDDGNQFYTEQVRPLRIYSLFGIHRRLHSLQP